MPTFEFTKDGKTYDVDAPDAATAASAFMSAMGGGEVGFWEAARRGAADAWTFGDEIRSGIGAAKDWVTGQDELGKSYERRQREEAEYSKKIQAARPGAYLGGNLAGNLAITLPLGPVAAGAMRGASGLKIGLAEGAATGTVLGLGEGEGAERLGNAGLGAVVGGGAGAAFGKLGDSLFGQAAARDARHAADEASASLMQQQADSLGLGQLNRAQLTGDPAKFQFISQANDGSYMAPAQRVVQEGLEAQRGNLAGAMDNLADDVALPGAPRFSHQEEAARALQGRMASSSDDIARAITQADADEQAVIQQGRAWGDQMAGGGRDLARNEDELGNLLGDSIRGTATEARRAAGQRFDELAEMPGEFRPEAMAGLDDWGRQALTTQDLAVGPDTPFAARALGLLTQYANRPGIPNAAAASGAPAPATPITLRDLHRMRKQLADTVNDAYRAMRAPNASATAGADFHAAQQIREAFDARIQQMFDDGLFSGDPNVGRMFTEARTNYRDVMRQWFPNRPGDDVSSALRKIIDRDATPTEIANFFLGSLETGGRGVAVRLGNHISQAFPPGSNEFMAIRQAMWNRLVTPRSLDPDNPTITRQSAQRIASTLEDFAGNRGRALASTFFQQAELEQMQQLARTMRSYSQQRGASVDGLREMLQIAQGNVNPAQIIKMAVGTPNAAGRSNANWRLVQQVRDMYGPDSDEFSMLRQMFVREMLTVPEGAKQPMTQLLASRLSNLVDGNAKSLAETLFHRPGEIDHLRSMVTALKRMTPPEGTVNHSHTAGAIINWAQKNMLALAGGAGMYMTGEGQIGGGIQGAVGFGLGMLARRKLGHMKAQAYMAGKEAPQERLGRKLAGAFQRSAGPTGRGASRMLGASVGQAGYFNEDEPPPLPLQ